MVFDKSEHIALQISRTLPAIRNIRGRASATHHLADCIVQANFVVQVIEPANVDIIVVPVRIVYFGYKKYRGVLGFDFSYNPLPKFHRHHLGHITAESVHAFGAPIVENIEHFFPRIGHRIEISFSAILVINAVIQLYSFIPVACVGRGTELIIASRTCGKFLILLSTLNRATERLVRNVIKVIIRIERLRLVIARTKIFYAFRSCVAIISTGHVIGHKIYHDLHSGTVRPGQQGFEFFHTLRNIYRQVRVHIVIILYCVR